MGGSPDKRRDGPQACAEERSGQEIYWLRFVPISQGALQGLRPFVVCLTVHPGRTLGITFKDSILWEPRFSGTHCGLKSRELDASA